MKGQGGGGREGERRRFEGWGGGEKGKGIGGVGSTSIIQIYCNLYPYVPKSSSRNNGGEGLF